MLHNNLIILSGFFLIIVAITHSHTLPILWLQQLILIINNGSCRGAVIHHFPCCSTVESHYTESSPQFMLFTVNLPHVSCLFLCAANRPLKCSKLGVFLLFCRGRVSQCMANTAVTMKRLCDFSWS